MERTKLIYAINQIHELSNKSRWGRLLANPFRRAVGLSISKIIYPLTNKTFKKTAKTFWGGKMNVQLPAGLDIFLLGSKSDDSEIRMVKYFINHLQSTDAFIDVGAHYGFFTLLAAQFCSCVHAFEPSSETFAVLKENVSGEKNIVINNKAIADLTGTKTLMEFKGAYNEYNSLQTAGMEKEDWFNKVEKEEKQVKTTRLDEYCTENNLTPTCIKIDAEGFEFQVVSSLEKLLIKSHPVILMEYWNSAKMDNTPHKEAKDYLTGKGYKLHLIDDNGEAFPSNDPELICWQKGLASDNVVFIYV